MAEVLLIPKKELLTLLKSSASLRRWAKSNHYQGRPAGETLSQFWAQDNDQREGAWDGISVLELATVDRVLSKWEKDHKL